MYRRLQWDVLLVDDDPDVLQVTKLALKSTKVYDVPLKLTTCASKGEAMERLKTSSALPDLSLAMIDVVMESQHAGLELCGYIRNEMNNRVTPLIVRTGQAGLAPERSVVDDYDITAYITKVEATDDRLYTLVKSAIRSFLYDRTSTGVFAAANRLAEHGKTRADIYKTFQAAEEMAMTDQEGNRLSVIDRHLALIVDGEPVVGIGDYADKAKAMEVENALAQLPGQEFPNGVFTRDGELSRLKPFSDVDGPEVSLVSQVSFNPCPDFYTRIWLDFVRFIRAMLARTS